MPSMRAVHYRAQDGAEPVDAFIERLRDPAKQAALDNQIDVSFADHRGGRRFESG